MHNLFRIIAIGFVISIEYGSILLAQTSQACLECHSDNSLTMSKGKKEVSLYVNDKVLHSSVHRKLNCVACHTGFNPDDIPHKETITPVNCLSCHNKAILKHNFHPDMVNATGRDYKPNLSCKGCHGTHEVSSPKDRGAKWHVKSLANSCGSCHEGVMHKFNESAHGKAYREGMDQAPNCLTCHQGDITRVHAGRDSVQLKIAQAKMCESCHVEDTHVADKTVRGSGFVASYEKSIHGTALLKGNARAANCVNCHGSHEMNKSFVMTSRVNKMNLQEVCAKCHASVVDDYSKSVHAEALHKGNMDSPVCTDCHGEHDILKHTDPKSPVSPRNVSQQVCGQCHASVKLTQKYGLSTDRFQTFSDSYHGLSTRGGAVEVVNCSSCHGAHKIRNSSDSTSSVAKENIIRTCGKCHPGAGTRFAVGKVHVSEEKKDESPALYWIANIYVWLIVSLIGAMSFHNVLDLVRKIKRKLLVQQGIIEEHPARHRLYLRMTVNERVQHATMAISFICLVITGFMLRYPESWWVAGIRHLSDDVFEWRSWIHRIAGVVLVGISMYHIFYVTATRRGRELIRDLVPKPGDITDALNMVRYNFGVIKDRPLLGRFSYIEKSEYWALVWGTILMGVTGAILWFETESIGLFTKLGWDIARTIHFYEAILATLAILVWHFYFVIFNPDVYPMSLAWLTGKISEKDMEEEHPLELRKIRESELASEREKSDESKEGEV